MSYIRLGVWIEGEGGVEAEEPSEEGQFASSACLPGPEFQDRVSRPSIRTPLGSDV